ncbi:MAG: VWA domain-containing protein [Leptospira sp.]|nr:VWA domain-containing protein [Leptospira sp.]
MEWDQLLFYKGLQTYKKLKKVLKPKSPFYEYKILENEKYLLKLAFLIIGKEIKIRLGDGPISLNSNHLNFPESISVFETKERSLNYIKMLLTYIFLCQKEKMTLNFLSANAYYKILRKYEGFRKDLKSIHKEVKHFKYKHPKQIAIWTKRISETTISNETSFSLSSNFKVSQPTPSSIQKPKSEFKLKFDLDEAELLEIDRKKIEEYTLGHNFEKIETVEEFDGQWRDLDGSDNAEEESEALSELNLKYIIRSEDSVHTTVSTDSGSGTTLEVKEETQQTSNYSYHEWDFKARAYKENYCFVQEENFQETKLNYAINVITKNKQSFMLLRQKLFSLVQERIIKKKLPTGDSVDLDAMVDRYADLVAKITPSELVYTRNTKEISNLTLYFLLDLSLSTDSWIHGRRILDVERESLLLFAEALNSLDIPFEIGAFYSRTRNQCKFMRIKRDKDTWLNTRDKLGALEPTGYTRIGPALRHAGVLLEKSKTRQKWIILLTDANPNDYDRYEGKYGTEDVNQAVKELKNKGIFVHTLAIGKDEKPVIPKMMREASFQMLSDPIGISNSLQSFFAKALKV